MRKGKPMSIASDLIRDLQSEAERTRKVFAVLPEAKFEWRPHEKSMTLGALASHVAENPSWISAFVEPELDFELLMQSYKPFAGKTRAELVTALDAALREAVACLKGRPDEFFEETWTMRMGAKVLARQPRGEALRETGIHHGIHHRGQLVVYLRLLGVPLPQLYGPTADAPDFG